MVVRALRNTTPVEQAGQLPPIWREAFWPAEWIALRLSPVYHGYGVTKGDGGPVVVIPGFLCSDAIMLEMRGWLGRVGYQPYLSGIGRNIDCPNTGARRLLTTVERAHAETGRRVRIVGHSLGGLVGRALAQERPELVSQLIYVGSPIQGVHAHPAVTATAAMLLTARSLMGGGCVKAGCGCGSSEEDRPLPAGISHAAIYTRADGVVDWHDARERDSRRNHEVGGTHIGLVYNARAYEVLGRLLARAPH
jgi:pimeloyl-ACP methyl ester carboxylesterase